MSYDYSGLPRFDDRDAEIRRERMEARALLLGPRVGDFVRMPGEDGLRRFTYDWGDDIQTTWGPNSDGSFYLCVGGGMSYSGGLDPAILKSRLIDTGEVRDGRCWFFHHAFQQAHNGVHTRVPCRVYRYEPA